MGSITLLAFAKAFLNQAPVLPSGALVGDATGLAPPGSCAPGLALQHTTAAQPVD